MPRPAQTNHASATHHPTQVDHYVNTELGYGTLQGHPPFAPLFQTSPLMTTPKKHSEKRRVILDLSFPPDASVNYGIPRDMYLNEPFKLHLPGAQDLCRLIIQQGPGCLMWSVDLHRGYRQLHVCHLDCRLLGIHWAGHYYFDTAVPFGVRWGAMCMQRTSVADSAIARTEHIPTVPYIDDTACAQQPADAWAGMACIKALFHELSLQDVEKENLPHTVMTWLCVNFDTVNMTMSVPLLKIVDCLSTTHFWAQKSHDTKSEVRQYLGKLLHICECCPTLCLFVNRMLQTLRSVPEHGRIHLDPEFQADVQWILSYLPQYNGVQMIPDSPTLHVPLVVDSCLTGGGGHFGRHLYFTQYPHFILQCTHSISDLEILNLVIAIRLWAPLLAGHVIKVLCDNSAMVSVVQTRRGRVPFLLACAREIWRATTLFKFELRVAHLPGTDNHLADILNRYHNDESCCAQVDAYIDTNQPIIRPVPDSLFIFPS